MSGSLIARPCSVPDWLSKHPLEWWRGDGAVTSGARDIEAENDIGAVQTFLKARKDNANTYASYQKEVKRLLIWCQDVCRKPLSALRYNDIQQFADWLASPGPEFISRDRERAGQGRLIFYKKGLSPTSVKAAMRVIAALFNELEIGGYLSHNPARLYARRMKSSGGEDPCREPLPTDILAAIEEWLEGLAESSAEKAEFGALVSALMYMGLRTSEAGAAKLSGFHIVEGVGMRLYGFEVTGRGNKTRVVPVEERVQRTFECYRHSLGLPRPLESHEGGDMPLIGVSSRSGVYNRVRTLCKKVGRWLDSKGDPRADWLNDVPVFPNRMRHTAIRRWLDAGVSLEGAQENLGHANIDTTRRHDNRSLISRLQKVRETMDGKA